MRAKNLIVFLLLSVSCLAQKQYAFDYLIEYELISKNDSVSKRVFYLSNSKDNSYLARVSEIDSLNYLILFYDHEMYLNSNIKLLKEHFNKAEFIKINSNLLFNSSNSYAVKEKKYDFHKLNDTIINDKKLSVFQLKSNLNPKKVKRKKIGSNLYLIDENALAFFPIFFYPPAFKIWKKQKLLPEKLYFKKLFINYLNEVQDEESLIGIYNVDKKIIISN